MKKILPLALIIAAGITAIVSCTSIRTHGGSAKAIYVKKYVLNGKQLKEPHITHKQIMEGGTLDVYMTEK